MLTEENIAPTLIALSLFYRQFEGSGRCLRSRLPCDTCNLRGRASRGLSTKGFGHLRFRPIDSFVLALCGTSR